MANKWLVRIITLAVWALAAMSATVWSLKFAGSTSTPVAVTTVAESTSDGEQRDLARIFGLPSVEQSVAPASTVRTVDPGARLVLLGVVANRAKTGVALIAVDGKAAKPYRVGSQIEDSYTLKSVAARSATVAPLSQAGAAFTLELAPPANAPPAAFPRLPTALLPVIPPPQPPQLPQPAQPAR